MSAALRSAASTGRRGSVAAALLLACLLVLTVLPMLVLAAGSLLKEPPRALHFDLSGLTLGNYAAVFADPGLGALLGTTLLTAAVGTAGAAAIGVLLAWLTVRTDVAGRRILEAVAVMPMLVPPLVAAFAWDLLASPRNGLLNIAARAVHLGAPFNLYSIAGIGFIFSIYYAPYIFLFMSSALRGMDPSLEEAAAICGAGRARTMARVVLPLMAPALLSSLLLVFVFLIELFAIPAVLAEPAGIHFISVRIWELIGFAPPRINQASALGVLMLGMTVVLILLQNAVLRRRSFVTLAGKGVRPRRLALRGWRWPLGVASFAYLLLVVVLPYAALVLVAFRRSMFFSTLTVVFDPRQFSFEPVVSTLTDPVVQASLWNSMLVCAGTVILGTALYFTIAYTVFLARVPGRRTIEMVAMLPIALPGLVIGLGYLWTWISLPLGVYGTLWIMILAYLSQFCPQGVRAIGNSMVQIHPELEESARVCGARFRYRLRRVVLPLAWPGVQSAMVLLLVFSFREVSTALFLYTANTQVFSVTMFDYWVQGTTGSVATMTLVQTVLLLAVILLSQTLGRGNRPGASK